MKILSWLIQQIAVAVGLYAALILGDDNALRVLNFWFALVLFSSIIVNFGVEEMLPLQKKI